MFKMAAGEQDVHVKYTGKKISKVRWRPVSAGHASSSDFICGSWDDEVRLCAIPTNCATRSLLLFLEEQLVPVEMRVESILGTGKRV